MSRVRQPLSTGEPDPATGRTDDEHVADVAAGGTVSSRSVEHL